MIPLSTLRQPVSVCESLKAVAPTSRPGAVRPGSPTGTATAIMRTMRAAIRPGQRKILLLLGLLPAGLTLGYLFYLGCAAGFAISKFCGGAQEGIQGRVRSIIIPLRTHELHLHHWLISVVATVASAVHGFFLFAPGLFYGILGGLILQGILCYSDWHRIIKRKHLLHVLKDPDTLGIQHGTGNRGHYCGQSATLDATCAMLYNRHNMSSGLCSKTTP